MALSALRSLRCSQNLSLRRHAFASINFQMNLKSHSKPFSSKEVLSYTERQAKLGRPVSPHVTIYR